MCVPAQPVTHAAGHGDSDHTRSPDRAVQAGTAPSAGDGPGSQEGDGPRSTEMAQGQGVDAPQPNPAGGCWPVVLRPELRPSVKDAPVVRPNLFSLLKMTPNNISSSLLVEIKC